MTNHFHADEITCQTITLAGSDGIPRMRLHVDDDGGCFLQMTDLAGRTRLMASVSPGGTPTVALYDSTLTGSVTASVCDGPKATLQTGGGDQAITAMILPQTGPVVTEMRQGRVTKINNQEVPADG